MTLYLYNICILLYIGKMSELPEKKNNLRKLIVRKDKKNPINLLKRLNVLTTLNLTLQENKVNGWMIF